MDGIESLDWGTYAHFRYQAQKFPGILSFMQIAYYFSGYIGVSVLIVLTTLLFWLQSNRRAALVTLLAFAFSAGLIEAIHALVPRRRPPDAQNFLGTDAMLGSYPATPVFLFTLCAILLGIALWGYR